MLDTLLYLWLMSVSGAMFGLALCVIGHQIAKGFTWVTVADLVFLGFIVTLGGLGALLAIPVVYFFAWPNKTLYIGPKGKKYFGMEE